MKTESFKRAVSALIFLLIITVFTVNIYAGNSFDWYCVHAKDHKQPRCDASLSFIGEYGGYYLDTAHNENTDDKVVYLTFDAGYENGNVEKIVDTMEAEGVSGAFFVLGNFIEKNPDLVLRMAKNGNLICNHTYSHKDMTKATREQFENELKKLENTCTECVNGVEIAKYYRPPQGRFNMENLQWAQAMGYKTIFWSFAYADWDNGKQMSESAAKDKIMSNIHNGAVILLHPTSATNAAIIGDVIKELKSLGYRFGSLDELTASQSQM